MIDVFSDRQYEPAKGRAEVNARARLSLARCLALHNGRLAAIPLRIAPQLTEIAMRSMKSMIWLR
jgi:hypothetical protein